jgi:hypothetical protein
MMRISEKESNGSHFCVVSFRMKMGRVAEAPREEPWEEERWYLDVAERVSKGKEEI